MLLRFVYVSTIFVVGVMGSQRKLTHGAFFGAGNPFSEVHVEGSPKNDTPVSPSTLKHRYARKETLKASERVDWPTKSRKLLCAARKSGNFLGVGKRGLITQL